MLGKKIGQLNLTRCGVIRHIRDMRKNGNRFVVTPGIKERAGEGMPDYLKCGKYCYGLMFGRGVSVDGFVLCVSPGTAKAYGASPAPPPQADAWMGGGWYVLTVSSFQDKREVYRVLDDCYDAALRKYYTKSGAGFHKTYDGFRPSPAL